MIEIIQSPSGLACRACVLLLLSIPILAWAYSNAVGESDRKRVAGGHSFVAPEGWLALEGAELEDWVFTLSYPGIKPDLEPSIVIKSNERGEKTLDSIMETFKGSSPPGTQVLQTNKFQPKPDLSGLRVVLISPDDNVKSELVFIETKSSLIMIAANVTIDTPSELWERVITSRNKLIETFQVAE